jgi:hypothetical protein
MSSSPKKKFTIKKKKEDIKEEKESENPIETYIKSLDDKEQQAIKIAQDHLQSSFHIEKSNGYSNYLKSING